MGKTTPLYFWHIPKTAGTSFIESLDGHFPSEEIFTPQLLSQLAAAADGDLARSRLFRGHLAGELPRRLGRPVHSVTLLREPRARTISHLDHIWREPRHYLHQRLRDAGPSLTAVLGDPVVRLAVTDLQARYLGTAPHETRATALPLPVSDFLAPQAGYELAPLPPPPLLLARAIWRLLRMRHVGIAEELDAFAARIARDRDWPPPGRLPRSNTRPADSSPWRATELTPEEIDSVDGVNRLDHVLYRIGARLARPHRVPLEARALSGEHQMMRPGLV